MFTRLDEAEHPARAIAASAIQSAPARRRTGPSSFASRVLIRFPSLNGLSAARGSPLRRLPDRLERLALGVRRPCGPLARFVPERFLRSERLLAAVPLHKGTVRPKLPSLHVVGEERIQDAAEPRPVLRIHDRHDQLDPTVEVARHPIRATDEDLRVAAVSKLEDSRVL